MKDKNMSQEFTDFVQELIAGDERKMKFIDLTGLGIMEFTRDKFKKTLKETIDYIKK
jgi:ribonuclease G